MADPRIPEDTTSLESQVDSNQQQLDSELQHILQEKNPHKLAQLASEKLSAIQVGITDLLRGEPSKTTSSIVRGLGVVTIMVAALAFRLQAESDNKSDDSPSPTPVPERRDPPLPTPLSEVGEPLIVRTVEPGDSISSILAKAQPEKYLDQYGHFKTDDATQEALYSQIQHVLDQNRQILEEDNQPLYQAIDSANTHREAFTGPVTGLELKKIVQQIGGPSEVIVVKQGQILNITLLNEDADRDPNRPGVTPKMPPKPTSTPALKPLTLMELTYKPTHGYVPTEVPPLPSPIRHEPPPTPTGQPKPPLEVVRDQE